MLELKQTAQERPRQYAVLSTTQKGKKQVKAYTLKVTNHEISYSDLLNNSNHKAV